MNKGRPCRQRREQLYAEHLVGKKCAKKTNVLSEAFEAGDMRTFYSFVKQLEGKAGQALKTQVTASDGTVLRDSAAIAEAFHCHFRDLSLGTTLSPLQLVEERRMLHARARFNE